MTVTSITSETLEAFNAGKLGFTELAEIAKTDQLDLAKKPDAKIEVEPEEEVKEGEVEKPKKGNKLESRFSEITEARRHAERERDELKRERDELKAKLAPKQDVAEEKDAAGKKPDKADFTDAFEYAEKLSEWSAKKALADRDKADAEKAETGKREKVMDGFRSRAEVARLKYPDFDDLLASSKAAVSDPARDTIIESDYSHDILHALAEDDELADKVSKMKPADQVKWIGRMETKFEKADPEKDESEKIEPKASFKEEKKVAPPPINPVRGTRAPDNAVNDPGEFKGTPAEWKALRKKQGAQFA